MKICIVLFLILCVSPLSNIYAQSFSSLPAVVRSTGSEMNLERKIFEANSNSKKSDLIYEKAMLCLENGKSDEALSEIKRVNFISMNDLRSLDIYRLGYFNYAAGEFESARFYINLLELQAEVDSIVPPFYVLACLTHLELDDLERARFYLTKAIRNDSNLNKFELDSVVNTLLPLSLNRQIKSVSKAKKLSVVPGLGQLYAGYPIKALTSFTLVGLSLTYAVFSIINGYYVSGIATGISASYLFYSGGNKHAQYLVQVRNDNTRQKYSDRLLEFFNNYASLHKPN